MAGASRQRRSAIICPQAFRGAKMGILDFFSKKPQETKPVAVENVEELRKQLFEAIDRNHMTEFEHLCTDNAGVILKQFANWKKPPEEIKNDKDLFKKYAYCLMIIASYFQKQMNRGELMTMLTGIDDSELSRSWQTDLGQAQQLMQELKLEEAKPILQRCLDRASGVSGAGVEKFLPLTLGFLGECYFHSNEMDKAAEYMEKAYQLCNMSGDIDAALAYRSNLYEIYRYTSQADKAIQCAEEIAQKQYDRGELVQASNWREQCKSVKAGEPNHRVVVRIAEELFELDEIPKVEGEKVEFVLTRNRIELMRCTHKCFEARDIAQQGNFDLALEKLKEAMQYDPYSPQPHFLAGAICLAGRRYAEAVQCFEKVQVLCPGFETTIADLWLARQLNEGKMEHDACMMSFEVNNPETPVAERMKMCEDLIAKYPHFTEAYYKLGRLHAESGNKEAAKEIWLKGVETFSGENDAFSRIFRDLALITDAPEEKKKYLEYALNKENANPLAQAMSRFMLRQMASD